MTVEVPAMLNKVVIGLLGWVLLHAAPALGANPYIDTGPDAEQSFDGLYRVKRSRLDAAWVREDFDLSRYEKLMVRGAGIAYRPIEWSGSATSAKRRGETDFPITEESRDRLAQALREEVMEELAKGERYVLTDAAGEDVLLLVVGLIDVVSHVPPEEVGRSRTFLRSVGEATMVLELRDSLTGAILARAADRREAGGPWMQEVDPVTARSEVKRLGSTWGRLLRQRLDDVMTMGE